MRAAYDLPLEQTKDGFIVSDDRRIRATLDTIEYLLERDCSLVIVSYLGRPKGKTVKELSLAPIANRLSELINKDVHFVPDCLGREVEEIVSRREARQIVLLENTRFHPEEEKADSVFAGALAKLGEVCVFDAFAQAHRVHSSTTGLTERLPTVFGFLFEKEILAFDKILEAPKRPFVTILGGVKIGDKAKVIERLGKISDYILIGGALSHPFLLASGVEIGSSKLSSPPPGEAGSNPVETARRLLNALGDKLQLPRDLAAASSAGSQVEIIDIEIGEKIPPSWQFVDIGPKTRELFAKEIQKAKTVLWNGPLGVFEKLEFSKGTRRVAEAMADNKQAVTVAGGGDTERALADFGFIDELTHVSTGGGASLYYIAHKHFPIFDTLNSYEN